jgi:hypothetical protein
MPDKPYSKREIDILHDSIHEKLDVVIEQVKYTNGKLKKMTMALVLAFGLIIGLGANDFSTIMSLLI